VYGQWSQFITFSGGEASRVHLITRYGVCRVEAVKVVGEKHGRGRQSGRQDAAVRRASICSCRAGRNENALTKTSWEGVGVKP